MHFETAKSSKSVSSRIADNGFGWTPFPGALACSRSGLIILGGGETTAPGFGAANITGPGAS